MIQKFTSSAYKAASLIRPAYRANIFLSKMNIAAKHPRSLFRVRTKVFVGVTDVSLGAPCNGNFVSY